MTSQTRQNEKSLAKKVFVAAMLGALLAPAPVASAHEGNPPQTQAQAHKSLKKKTKAFLKEERKRLKDFNKSRKKKHAALLNTVKDYLTTERRIAIALFRAERRAERKAFYEKFYALRKAFMDANPGAYQFLKNKTNIQIARRSKLLKFTRAQHLPNL